MREKEKEVNELQDKVSVLVEDGREKSKHIRQLEIQLQGLQKKIDCSEIRTTELQDELNAVNVKLYQKTQSLQDVFSSGKYKALQRKTKALEKREAELKEKEVGIVQKARSDAKQLVSDEMKKLKLQVVKLQKVVSAEKRLQMHVSYQNKSWSKSCVRFVPSILS